MPLTLAAVLLTAVVFRSDTCSARHLLQTDRPLTAAELDVVVAGVRQALSGLTVRLVEDDREDREMLLGPTGMPRMIRIISTMGGGGIVEGIASVTTADGAASVVRNFPTERFERLIEYTEFPARRCTTGPGPGTIVFEHLRKTTAQTWTTTARASGPHDVTLARPLQALHTLTEPTSGGTRTIGNATARAIVWRDPDARVPAITGDPAPDPTEFIPMHSLWIDIASLRPLRWELSQRQAIVAAVDFVYGPLDLRRPAGTRVPACIP